MRCSMKLSWSPIKALRSVLGTSLRASRHTTHTRMLVPSILGSPTPSQREHGSSSLVSLASSSILSYIASVGGMGSRLGHSNCATWSLTCFLRVLLLVAFFVGIGVSYRCHGDAYFGRRDE